MSTVFERNFRLFFKSPIFFTQNELSEDIPADGTVKQLLRRRAARLGKHPHELGDRRFQRHAARLQEFPARTQPSADGILVHCAPLPLDLRGEHRRLSAPQKAREPQKEGVVLVIGKPARPERFDDQPVAMRVEIVEDLRAQSGDHLQDKDVLVERVKKDGRALRFGIFDIVKGSALAHDGDGGEIDARKGVVTACARLFGARPQNDAAVEHDAHAKGALIRAEQEGVRQIAARIGIARISGPLRARQNDGFGCILHEIGERGGGVRHRVRPVRDDKAVVRPVMLFDDARDRQPMHGVDISAVQIEGLDGIHLAHVSDFRHAAQQLLGRERGREPLFRLLGGDRASRSDQKDLLFHQCNNSAMS